MVRVMFFFKNGVDIESPTKFDMPLNKETKPNTTTCSVDPD